MAKKKVCSKEMEEKKSRYVCYSDFGFLVSCRELIEASSEDEARAELYKQICSGSYGNTISVLLALMPELEERVMSHLIVQPEEDSYSDYKLKLMDLEADLIDCVADGGVSQARLDEFACRLFSPTKALPFLSNPPKDVKDYFTRVDKLFKYVRELPRIEDECVEMSNEDTSVDDLKKFEESIDNE